MSILLVAWYLIWWSDNMENEMVLYFFIFFFIFYFFKGTVVDNHYGKFIYDNIWYTGTYIHIDNHMYTEMVLYDTELL